MITVNGFQRLWLTPRFQKQLAAYKRQYPKRSGAVYRVMDNLMAKMDAVNRVPIQGNPTVSVYRTRVSRSDRLIDAPVSEANETAVLNIGDHTMNEWAERYTGPVESEIDGATQLTRSETAQTETEQEAAAEPASSRWYRPKAKPGTYGQYVTEQDLHRHQVPDMLIETILATADVVPLTDTGLDDDVADALETLYINRMPDSKRLPQPTPSLDGPRPIPITREQLPALFKMPMTKFLSRVSDEQERLIKRPANSFTIVKGAAGTGKTVVGLRWIEQLIKHPPLMKPYPPILFVCFNQVLKDAADQLLTSILGDKPSAFDVEVKTIYELLRGLATEKGLFRGVDAQSKEALLIRLKAARAACQAPTTRTTELPDDFIYDEIAEVIYGRAIKSEDDYINPRRTVRTGRTIALNEAERRYIWAVYEQFHRYSIQNQSISWPGLAAGVTLALNESPPTVPRYRAIVVDEAQDLLPCMFRSLFMLQGRTTDGMMILGDAVQNVYRSAFRWSDTGFQVAGGHVTYLRDCFRTTRQIIDCAAPLLARQTHALGDDLVSPEATDHDGPPPEFVLAPSPEAELEQIAQRIWQTMDEGMPPSSIAVFANTRTYLSRIEAVLSQQGIPTERYDANGRRSLDISDPSVKLVTTYSAKGIEFPAVFICGITEKLYPSDGDEEQCAKAVRVLYTAMLRSAWQLTLSAVEDEASGLLHALRETGTQSA